MYKVERHDNGGTPTYWISMDGRIEKTSFMYLQYLKKQNKSPNTIKRYAWSICYFLNYLQSANVEFENIACKGLMEQIDVFKGFLCWIKEGKHKVRKNSKEIKNKSCNDRLKDVFQYYSFLVNYEDYEPLKVLRERASGYITNVGVYKKTFAEVFDFYLEEYEDDRYEAHVLTDEEINKVMDNLTNPRDKALMSLMIDTGIRIGEALGLHRNEVNLVEKFIKVQFSPKNENGARAKRGEYRKAYFSSKTKKLLAEYMDSNKNVLSRNEILFIKLQGKDKGHGMNKADVDSLMRRIEAKTGIHIYSHLLRHRFAEERRQEGWDLLSISGALGHRSTITTETYLDAASVSCEKEQREYFEHQEKGLDIDFLLS